MYALADLMVIISLYRRLGYKSRIFLELKISKSFV